MEGRLLKMQQRKMMMTTSALDVKEAAGLGGGEENFVVVKLRELLLVLGSIGGLLLEKFDEIFSPVSWPEAPPPPPQDYGWIIRLTAVLLVGLSLGGLIYYYFFRCSGCSGGGWGATKILKGPRSNSRTALYSHEFIIAALAMLLIIILSLASLYYYYCFQSACYGEGDVDTTMTMVNVHPPGGRVGY